MVYLDNASTSFPKPIEVYDQAMKCMKNYAVNPGKSVYSMALKTSSKIMETRQRISKLFNILDSSNIIFTSNSTEALNIGIKGVVKRGDHIISTVIEHNSVLRPLNNLNKEGTQVTLLSANKEGYVSARDFRREIRKNTKVFIINHASNVLGTVQNIHEIGQIARNSGIIFLVDASQSAGFIPIDVVKDNIDILAFSGHKALFGPQGTGGLFVRSGIEVDYFKYGDTNGSSNSMNHPDFLPDKFECGTLNVPGIVGLCEGIKFIEQAGIKNIRLHQQSLLECLIGELRRLSYVKIYGSRSHENKCPIVSINIEGMDSSSVAYLLNLKNIAVSSGCHSASLIHGILGTCSKGTIRISPGYFNDYEDIESLIDAIKEIYKNR